MTKTTNPPSGPNADEVGKQLLLKGCRQGAIVELSARVLWLSRSESSEWCIRDETISDAMLVVVSQDCDIYASIKNEPRIEGIAAKWTSDAGEIHIARKGNSPRLFLLKKEGAKGLIADARHRTYLDKHSLLELKFIAGADDERTRLRFARWVAGRYDRPALRNEHVAAIQKPVVTAVQALIKTKASLLGVLERVAELRFAALPDDPPWRVHLLAMLDDGEELTVEEEAQLASWLEEVLVGQHVKDIAINFRTAGSISVQDYSRTTHLQLDHFSADDR